MTTKRTRPKPQRRSRRRLTPMAKKLRELFRACDEREKDREPDWPEHLRTIEDSRRGRR